MILSRKTSGYALLILATVCVTYFIENFLRSAPSALTPLLVEELGLTLGLAGLLISSYSILYGLMQIPSGFLSVALGPRKTILTFTAFALVGVFLFYLGRSIGTLFVAQLLVGFGFSVFYINAITLVTRWFPAEKRASAIGILSAASGLGNFAAYIGFPLSTGFAGGWRVLYLICSVILLANFVANFFILRNSPSLGNPDAKHEGGSYPRLILRVLVNKRVFPFIAGYVLTCFSWIFLSWLPKLLMDTHGLSYLNAGLVSSTATIAGIPGCIAVAFVSDRLRRRRLPLVAFSSIYTVLLALFLFLPRETPLIVLGAVATAIGFAVSLWVLLFSMVPEVLPREEVGIGLGLMNGLGTLGFALFAPIYGALIDASGSYAISNMAILVGGIAMTMVYALFTSETYGGAEKPD